MDARYAIDDELRTRLKRLARADDLVDLMLSLRDLDAMVTEQVRLARIRERMDDVEAEVEMYRSRERWDALDPELQDAIVKESMAGLLGELEERGATFTPDTA